jgi:hypothetical protein
VEIVRGGEKKIRRKIRPRRTEYSNEELNNNRDELREEKGVLIHQSCLQHAPIGRDGDTSTSTSKQVVSSIASLVESSEGAVGEQLKEVGCATLAIAMRTQGCSTIFASMHRRWHASQQVGQLQLRVGQLRLQEISEGPEATHHAV